MKMFENSHFATRPLYLQVRDALIQRIVLGDWKAGACLPNEVQLSQELAVSVGTVRKALEQMETERIVLRRQGRGTFVNDQSTCGMSIRFSSIRNAQGLRIEGKLVPKSVERGTVLPDEAGHLRIHKQAPVIRIHRLHTCNDHAFMIETCVLPEELFPNMPDEIGAYRICTIAQANSIYLSGAIERVRSVLATDKDAAEFGIAAGQPILELDRTIEAIGGKVVEWRVARCHLREKYYAAVVN